MVEKKKRKFLDDIEITAHIVADITQNMVALDKK